MYFTQIKFALSQALFVLMFSSYIHPIHSYYKLKYTYMTLLYKLVKIQDKHFVPVCLTSSFLYIYSSTAPMSLNLTRVKGK